MGRYKIDRAGPQNRIERRAAERGKTVEVGHMKKGISKSGMPRLRKWATNQTDKEED